MAIQQPVEDIEKIEQKLAEFSQQIDQSSRVLENLSSIQVQFEDLAQAYESFKTYSNRVKQKNQNLEVFRIDAEQRLEDVEKSLQAVQASFGTLQQDWENPRDAVEIYLDNMENRLRTELRGALSQLDQSGLSSAHVDKLEKLDTQVRALRTAVRTGERRSRILQNWLVVTSIVAVMGMGMQLFTPFLKAKSDPPAPAQTETPQPEVVPETVEGETEAGVDGEFTPTLDFRNTIGQ